MLLLFDKYQCLAVFDFKINLFRVARIVSDGLIFVGGVFLHEAHSKELLALCVGVRCDIDLAKVDVFGLFFGKNAGFVFAKFLKPCPIMASKIARVESEILINIIAHPCIFPLIKCRKD